MDWNYLHQTVSKRGQFKNNILLGMQGILYLWVGYNNLLLIDVCYKKGCFML